MFGISGSEFLVILIVAIIIVPSSKWPDVAKSLGKLFRAVKELFGKIQDNIDDLENNIAKDMPIDKLSKKTMDDMIETFSSPVKKGRKK